ncbi:MAG TPA: glycosyltransferase family 4 protein [Acidimicrobiales bacterium]|nr:glycosyltransferase family 4 protein [Acidimicrobiales bacterium]
MRIGLVCPYSLTHPGGVQGQVLAQARALRALGHDTRVLAPCDGPPPETGVVPLGNSVPLAGNGSVAQLAPDPACLLRTLAALDDEDFDVVHLHEPFCPGPTLTTLAFGRTPMVGTFHRAGASASYRFGRPVAIRLARRLAVRVAVSEDARRTAADALQGEYLVLHNGIEVERFAKATPWPATNPTVLFVGRHEPRKGLGVLVEAMSSVGPEVRLWVAGEGSETAKLRRLTAGDPRVEWLGRLDDAEVASRMRGADVLCAPSLHGESFGVVLLEGMAASTPVVASDLPGYRNVAGPGVHALLVPPGDPTALADALCRVLEDPALAAELVAAGEARAAELSMERLAERYLELYEDVIKPGRARRSPGGSDR